MEQIKVEYSALRPGNRLSRTAYYEVVSVTGASAKVKNEEGFVFDIGRDIFQKEMYSATQFSKVERVSRTEMIDILANAGDTVFTVSFHKQSTSENIAAAIKKINGGRIATSAEIAKAIKEANKGEERQLTGYLVSVETGFGRSRVIDLMIDKATLGKGTNMREVDHRTLNWIIFKGVKYELKK